MSWTYRPALDGLRSLAVYLVLLFHTGWAALGGGFIGVDLFFVLSGFLVSNVILSEIDQTGRLDFGRFYARRVRRLLPAAVVVVVATVAVFLLIVPVTRRLPLVQDAQSALLYVANWNFLFKEGDYFAEDVESSPFLHFWSLAIEEQFYVLFPVVLLLLVRAARRRRSILPAALAGLFLLSLTSQLVWAQRDVAWAYYGTDARLYQLLAGALLAVALRGSRRPNVRQAGLAAGAGLVGMLVLGSGAVDMTPSWRGIAATAAAVLLVGGLMVSESGVLGRLFSRRTPVYLGQISYGTYLWHWPVILVIEEVLVLDPVTVALLAIPLSTGLAALSFQVLEHPIRTAAALRPFRWRTVVVGVGVSALVAATVVPTALVSERRPRLAAATAADSFVDTAVSPEVSVAERNARVPDLDWAAMGAEPIEQPECTAEAPRDCVVVEGSGPHVTLIGDSHANMLLAMFMSLAEEHDFTLSTHVMPGCPWQAGIKMKALSDARSDACIARRGDWYDEVLPRLDPDVVVLAGLARDHRGWEGGITRLDGVEQPLPALLFDVNRATVERIARDDRRVVLLSSIPGTGNVDPLDCLATATRLHQCEVELPEPPVSDAQYDVLASLRPDVYSVDVGDAFCIGAPTCLPVVDGSAVWRNRLHVSREITLRQREEVWQRILASGALEGL